MVSATGTKLHWREKNTRFGCSFYGVTSIDLYLTEVAQKNINQYKFYKSGSYFKGKKSCIICYTMTEYVEDWVDDGEFGNYSKISV